MLGKKVILVSHKGARVQLKSAKFMISIQL